MTTEIEKIFPEIKDPKWIEQRDEMWVIALKVSEFKKEYRKKELEMIRHYFITGELRDGFPFLEQSNRLLKLFPIQTKEGYDYYYQTHDFTEEQLYSNFRSAFVNKKSSGMKKSRTKSIL